MNNDKYRKINEIVVYPDGRVDAKNASIYLGLSGKTLAMKRCDGSGPVFIKRGRIFYFLEDLDSWLMERAGFTSTVQAAQKIKISVTPQVAQNLSNSKDSQPLLISIERLESMTQHHISK